jgi:HAD superfamily hydrolase (TIGR01484 family)
MNNTHKTNVTDKPKKDVFVIFTDLDGTFSPVGIKGLQRFVDLVKALKQKENVDIKFCPVSGRPGDYVLSVMHMVRNVCKEEGLLDVAPHGIGEQGALLVDGIRSYRQVYLGNPQETSLKKEVEEILKKGPFWHMVVDEVGKRYTCSIHIKKEYAQNMTADQKQKIYDRIGRDILEKIKRKVSISMSHNCLEVMTPEISKAKAIARVLRLYQRLYHVRGMLFAGDAQNDKIAVKHFSHLSEIPGVPAHVFLPGNATSAITTKALEQWKEQNPNASINRIRQAKENYFEGVITLMYQAWRDGSLLSNTKPSSRSMDDLDLFMQRKNRKQEVGMSF